MSEGRRAHLLAVGWEFGELSCPGTLTYYCSSHSVQHIGLLVCDSTPMEVVQHSRPSVSWPSARGQRAVSLDFGVDSRLRWHGVNDAAMYTASSTVVAYPILSVGADRIHESAETAIDLDPYNAVAYRCPAACCGWFDRACCVCRSCPAPSGYMAASTCVGASARVIAHAITGDDDVWSDDRAAVAALGILPRSCPGPTSLSGHAPIQLIDALRESGVIGAPVGGIQQALLTCSEPTRRTATVGLFMLR